MKLLNDFVEYLELDDINKKCLEDSDKKSSEKLFNIYINESLYVLNYLGGNDIYNVWDPYYNYRKNHISSIYTDKGFYE